MAEIQRLVDQLGDSNGLLRQQARHALVEIGAEAVPALVDALSSPTEHKRWEAAKALEAIPDARAAEGLVRALEDRAFGVRWLAANALIGIGPAVLAPLLRGLTGRVDSQHMREGAGHVLRGIGKKDEVFKTRVARVLDALESVEPVTSTPWAARQLLAEMGLIPHDS